MESTKLFSPGSGVLLSKQPWKIRSINGLLWICECQATIELFDLNLVKADTIDLDDDVVGHVYDVLHVNADDFVIAGQKGLYFFSLENKSTELLQAGVFKSISRKDSTIFAFEYESAKIFCFEYESVHHRLTMTSTISPPLSVREKQFATIAVRNDEIFVCSMSDDKIYVLDLSGALLRTVGEPGNLTVGRLSYPMIAQQLTDGSLLVADHDNHRYQLLRASDWVWEQVEVFGGMEFPRGGYYTDGKLFTATYSDKNWLQVNVQQG